MVYVGVLCSCSPHANVSSHYPIPLQYVEDNLGVMSVGFLLSSPDDAVIWRGPKKNGLSLCSCGSNSWFCL